MKIEPGKTVVAVLQSPREKIFGVLTNLTAAGVHITGIDLNYFNEWIKAINSEEPYLPAQHCFYPMWRVERLTADSGSEGLPSLQKQFEQKTGRKLADFV